MHMAQLMPLPLTVSCFSKIHIGFTFLVPAHSGSPGQRAVKQVCVLSPCDAILALIKVYAVVTCPSVHSCITSRYCRNQWTNQAGFWRGGFLLPIPHCCVVRKFGYLKKFECCPKLYNNNNNNDRLTAFDPGQPG